MDEAESQMQWLLEVRLRWNGAAVGSIGASVRFVERVAMISEMCRFRHILRPYATPTT
jgi:hypothetical protein